MKKQNIKYDMNLLLRGGDGRKADRAHRRIVSYVLERKEKILERLDEVMIRLERAYWTQKETKPISVALIRAIIDGLLAHNLQYVFLEITAYLFMGGHSFNTREMMLFNGQSAGEQLRAAARQWFYLEWLRYVGETVERSVQFALFLLEQYSTSSERVWSDLVRGKDARSVAASNRHGVAVLLFISESAVCPPSEETASKMWIERLIEGAENDPTVEEVLASVIWILAVFRKDNRIQTLVARDTTAKTVTEFIADRLSGHWKPHPFRPQILLLPKHNRILMGLEAQRSARTKREREQGERILSWVAENHERLLDLIEWRVQAVKERPRRGLRPNGLDHITVDVTPLRNAGLRAIVLHPEGYTFPEVGVDVIVRKETPHLLRLRLPDDFQQATVFLTDALYNATHPRIELLVVLFLSVFTDILYRIVVSGEELREKKRWHKTGDESAGVRQRIQGVRPHFRRLAIGLKANEDAIERAKKTIGWLPPGCTFVRAHFRGGRLVYDLPTEPVAVYGDEDLFEMGEWS